tara:strand:- start:233 stop:427 length:195 start_codon:yes stop_codon:yes gene_type:complete
MKRGDLVKMKGDPFPLMPLGFGLLMEISSSGGWNCIVFFPDLVRPDFSGYKWCNDNDLEVISEC